MFRSVELMLISLLVLSTFNPKLTFAQGRNSAIRDLNSMSGAMDGVAFRKSVSLYRRERYQINELSSSSVA